MSRRIMRIPLVLIAVVVGFVLAYLAPLRETEPAGPTPTSIVTGTIPRVSHEPFRQLVR